MIDQTSSGLGDNFAALGDINILKESRNITSNLSKLINILGKRLADNNPTKQENEPFTIEKKIAYNNVKKYKPIIDEYGLFVGKLSAIYKEHDQQNTNMTYFTLANIRQHYLKVKGDIISANPGQDELSIIQTHADSIFSEVEKRLLNEINKSSNITEPYEIINVSLLVIMIDAFMRCKILEEPN
ncbi:hypothetical protein GCM10011375_07290 [Hymenobacter qilianensis]|uniref:Uncharacterized protein n=2 Tax=Hymenobacter qilianensis TaxID=1385715 RepID=A0ACB5PN40_9BACT|nr:ABC-three component system protein [Hymenobacter qilianensis]QNP53631.1 hypothetical protein H9L05_08800 [Hymenobacter qilianensis]GGF54449.1 hypothetical protein GCM10011375_07290 [Hymenobacter qilianensis]